MAAQRAEYVAKQVINDPGTGVRGYSEGDPVPAGVVENWGLTVGEQVEPSDLGLLPKPAKNAKRADWAAYALSRGFTEEQVDGMTRDGLADYFEEPALDEPVEEPAEG